MPKSEDEPPQSVIHAPTGFTEFVRSLSNWKAKWHEIDSRQRVNDSPPLTGQSSGSSSQQSDVTITSPLTATNQAAEKVWHMIRSIGRAHRCLEGIQ
jgi:hypothetical protein